MDLTPSKTEYSFRSSSSNSSRCGTPKPAEPTSDCEKRRQAILRLEQQNVLIDGYKKFLYQERNSKDEAGIRKQLEKNLRETIEAKSKLETVAMSCSWCKEVCHNKESCFNVKKIGSESCNLGAHANLIVPPTWIVKLPCKVSSDNSNVSPSERKPS
ncbi:diacylglycerol kinase [Trichonephila inaurata madagascariensis]|uniref:Diacylglycerol kinase n=1 Tax=Trichonephila inaurata madagascariensis TaxID=2747483 RepID=A0A8X7C8G7_9ARAC|nr:diacylglycerol kinase [Trichonephila inaurata madagascariensis]